MNLSVIFCVLTINVMSFEAARILGVFPTPAISHQFYFRALTKALADIGHELVIVTPNPHPKGEVPHNVTEIDIHDMAYDYWKNNVIITTDVKGNYIQTRFRPAVNGLKNIFQMILHNEDFKKLIAQRFDLLILEAWARPTMSLAHFFKVPVIRASSLGALFDNLRSVGAPTHPILYPTTFPERVYKLSFLEKIQRLYHYYCIDIYHDHFEDQEDEMLKRHFGANFPRIGDLSRNIGYLFLNVHPIWECNRPVPINVIYLNGLHMGPAKELPETLKSYLDSSSNGVIYVSLGTSTPVSVVPQDKLKVIIGALASLHYDVLWKWDNDTMDNMPENFRISRWLPQADLLRHPNIKLFISQAGIQSTDEAIAAEVPLIGIPIFGDQRLNAENYVYHGIGLQINMGLVTVEELKAAIKKVINDTSYKENIVKLHRLFLDQRMSAMERAVWWTEHVLRHGAEHLRAPAATLHLLDYHEIPLLMLLLAFCFIITCIFIGITYILIKYISYVKDLQCTYKVIAISKTLLTLIQNIKFIVTYLDSK